MKECVNICVNACVVVVAVFSLPLASDDPLRAVESTAEFLLLLHSPRTPSLVLFLIFFRHVLVGRVYACLFSWNFSQVSLFYE